VESDIREYARLGLVHHMLYPRCVEDPDYHAATLLQFIERDDIETFDCCLPYGDERRQRLIDAIRGAGKEVVYATHLFPLRKISFASQSASEQGLIRIVLADQIEIASSIGATGIVFASGADVASTRRAAARGAFADFCRWFCGELKARNMVALLEPFDREVDKKFLYGPTAECMELIRSLEPEVDNLAIELDMAHLPLMGEGFAEAIRAVAPALARVHLGNCATNPSHPFYGDQHPPIGIEGGEVDVEQLVEILSALREVGYLRRESRGALVLEGKPFPGRTPDETVEDNFARLGEAWRRT